MQSRIVVAVVVFCCIILMQTEAGMLGGSSDVDVNDPEIKELAGKSIAKISAMINDGKPHELVKVVSAKKQVVAGDKYTLEILVKDGDHQDLCTVTIWQKKWENFEEVKVLKCDHQ
ncbi:unnamed protein product [Anisakis simplex]|uniref:Ani s 4 allergen n=1 Tax=Anisakis simplex TaxID=6269 RepID=Q14QT4_ANISI|nr:ani s 4 allergen [Anisakis simplex]VDK49940.1 unnamed protein product [Anisakis simplex]